ncbi:MAG TPA: hypothetical protein VL284_02625 [Thermoanaerobaculia bacterium]|nr:hypothetical protein [Thermoanaerobaculia bacterium]
MRAADVSNPFDPLENICWGHQVHCVTPGSIPRNVDLALAAYNAGPDLVAKVGPSATKEAVDCAAAINERYDNALHFLS